MVGADLIEAQRKGTLRLLRSMSNVFLFLYYIGPEHVLDARPVLKNYSVRRV